MTITPNRVQVEDRPSRIYPKFLLGLLCCLGFLACFSIKEQAETVWPQVAMAKDGTPISSVNGDLWPINYEANRRHMFSSNAMVLKEADHFLMMDRPGDFNKALEQAILMLTKK